MRPRLDACWRCLRGQNHHPSHAENCPQMCAMAWRRLRSVVLSSPQGVWGMLANAEKRLAAIFESRLHR